MPGLARNHFWGSSYNYPQPFGVSFMAVAPVKYGHVCHSYCLEKPDMPAQQHVYSNHSMQSKNLNNLLSTACPYLWGKLLMHNMPSRHRTRHRPRGGQMLIRLQLFTRMAANSGVCMWRFTITIFWLQL